MEGGPIRPALAQAYVPPAFAPGEVCQFNWSQEHVELTGVMQTIKAAHFRLTFSRQMFVVAYPGETQKMAVAVHVLPMPGKSNPQAPDFHLDNVSAYHGRLKEWLRPFPWRRHEELAALSRLASDIGGVGPAGHIAGHDPRRYRAGTISTNDAIRAKIFVNHLLTVGITEYLLSFYMVILAFRLLPNGRHFWRQPAKADARDPGMFGVHVKRSHNSYLVASRKGHRDDSKETLGLGSLVETFASRFNARANNFDAMRLFLAVVVVFCHCFSLSGIARDPIDSALHLGYGGTLAVDGFLVISGFLVTRSFLERSLDDYVISRLLRILPGLAVVTLVEVFVIGAAFTRNDLWTYLSYVGFRHLWNVSVFGLDAQIYGVFANTDPPWMMNGSLWTIPIECSFYIILPLVALVGLRRAAVPLYLASIVAQPVVAHFGLGDISLFTNVHAAPFVDLASYFLAGAIMWIERERIPFSTGTLALCLIGLYAAAGVALNDVALKLFLPYVVLYSSLAGGIGSRLKRWVGDLSYGTYLFGFPITLSVIEVTGGLPPYRLFVAVIVTVLACAWVSWHLVERPCLRWRIN